MQVPLQAVRLPMQLDEQVFERQTWPAWQTTLHPPQFVGSPAVGMQRSLQ
jgi:hypothetical protein